MTKMSGFVVSFSEKSDYNRNIVYVMEGGPERGTEQGGRIAYRDKTGEKSQRMEPGIAAALYHIYEHI